MRFNCDVNVEIDLMEAFNDLRSSDQKSFVNEVIELIEDDELSDELEKRGYKAVKTKD
jgi:hypothetical protein